jgi:glycosyltransferase involved in cell wall biosynthesis
MQHQKGVTRLLAAMPLVWEAVPEARLLLAGPRLPDASTEDRAFREALEALPEPRRPQAIHIGAFAEQDKASIFDACDVFAMPSTSESFGIVFLEAWVRGKPVIGARIGAVASVIHDGVDGILVPPDSVRALADAVVALLRHPERRAAMGEAGRRKTLERFTWDRITDRLEGVYASVLDRTGRPGDRAP